MDKKTITTIIKAFLEDYISDLETRIAGIIEKILKKKLQDLRAFIELRAKQGEKGEKGDKGDPGNDGTSIDKQEVVNEILANIPMPKDGKDADELGIITSVLKQIPPPLPPLPPLELSPEEVRDKLQSLQGDNRLHASAIMGLPDLIKTYGGGGTLLGGGGQGSWKISALSGDFTGSNTAFTYIGDLPAENSEQVILDGILQDPGDYTLSKAGAVVTITYDNAPSADLDGARHYIKYM